jgi:hypothetical protein
MTPGGGLPELPRMAPTDSAKCSGGPIIRQHLQPVATTTPIVLVSQGWPCWLSTVLALHLLLEAVFVPQNFRHFFRSFDVTVPWCGLDDLTKMLDWPGNCDSHTVLASGSPTFANTLSTKLKGHHKGILLYATDFVLWGRRMQDVQGLLHRFSDVLESHGLNPTLVAHTNFGGATSAIHAVGAQGVDLDVFFLFDALPH